MPAVRRRRPRRKFPERRTLSVYSVISRPLPTRRGPVSMGWGSGDGPAGRKPPSITLQKVYCTIKIQKVIYPSAAGSRINNGRAPDGHKRRGPGLPGGGVPPCPVCPPRLRVARRLRSGLYVWKRHAGHRGGLMESGSCRHQDDPNKVGSGTPPPRTVWEAAQPMIQHAPARRRKPRAAAFRNAPGRGIFWRWRLDKWGMAFYYLIS